MTGVSDQELRAAAEALAAKPGKDRALKLVHKGQVFWVKRATGRGAFLHWQRGNPKRLLEHETRAMIQMHAAGLPVPSVLHAAAGLLVMTDVGTPLDIVWASADEKARIALARQSTEALIALHQAKAAHGSPHLRNLAIAEGRLGFFDLEQAVPNNADAQARQHDLGVLLYSLFGLGARRDTVAGSLALYRAQFGDEVPLALARKVRRLAWLRPLIRVFGYIDDRRRPDRPHRIYPALLQMGDLMADYPA